jgi:predicted RND superfamily exporter protein
MNSKVAGTYMANLYFSVKQPVKMESKSSGDDFDEFGDDEDVVIPTVRDPKAIAYIEKLGNFIQTVKNSDGNNFVGGVTSIADVLKKIGKVAVGDPTLPKTKEQVSQYIFLFESGDIKRGKDLWKIIKPGESDATQMWIYINNGDNQNMTVLMNAVDEFMKKSPPPMIEGAGGNKVPLQVNWTGLVHINNVWQAEMVGGMGKALMGSFVIVFFMMVFLFRSISWSFIAMLPLTITIMFIYGAIGFAGKFYDMPIAVLSSLTLGLSIDFAIHFIEHARMYGTRFDTFKAAYDEMFNGTAQAIWRNVLVISVGFTPLFFAGLVPYMTVGSFFFSIMLVSGLTTLLVMPALLKQFYKYLPSFKGKF